MKKYLIEMVVLICGAVIMILELIAARILSPYVGSSNTTWTSIIGVILLSMSLGYWWGGKLADKKPDYRMLSYLIMASSILVSFVPIFETLVIRNISQLISNLPIAAVLSTFLTFAFPSFLLATISPYAIKLKETGNENIGKVAGRLSALSTLGSIAGTFSAGFFLIPSFGNKTILLATTILLFLIAVIIYTNKDRKYYLLAAISLVIIVLSVFIGKKMFAKENPGILVDTDSEYSRILITQGYDKSDRSKTYKLLRVDRALESYIDNTGKMGSEYLYYYDLFDCFNPDAKDTMIIGGAAYTYPTYYLNRFKDKNIDVVEIDPKMTELAKEHFNLKDDERLAIYHQDGRSYINKADKKYDTIFIDAFKGFNVPFELTTVEALTNMKNMLTEDGLVIANVISAVEGEDSGFLKQQYATFAEVFDVIKLFAVRGKESDKTIKQNLILIGFNKAVTESNNKEGYEEYLQNEIKFSTDAKPFTDDYAPVQKYIQ